MERRGVNRSLFDLSSGDEWEWITRWRDGGEIGGCSTLTVGMDTAQIFQEVLQRRSWISYRWNTSQLNFPTN
jgi:hypothetical protein